MSASKFFALQLLIVLTAMGCDRNKYADANPPFMGHPYEQVQPGKDEHPFVLVENKDTSTFGVDVDTASYTNARKVLATGQMPRLDQLRTEEFINYFDYRYEPPIATETLKFSFEVGPAPWAPEHRLVKIAAKAKEVPAHQVPPLNLVFLIDVSGSMLGEGRLGLVKYALTQLAKELRAQDRISIVTYADSIGVPIRGIHGHQQELIVEAIQSLEAGGSTAGHPGLQKAYELARESFVEGGVNRVILSTDGDFNVGIADTKTLKRYILKEAQDGVLLTVHGYGMGNLRDDILETLADNGNGAYAYIDSRSEALRVFRMHVIQTLVLVAKDVKLQVKFNPAYTKAYRLIGYENRQLDNEDFEDESIDSGDMGSGHTVTAFYEVQLAETSAEAPKVFDLEVRFTEHSSQELRRIRTQAVDRGFDLGQVSDDFRFAAAAAALALKLADSKYIGEFTYSQILDLAQNSGGSDTQGQRLEFMKIVQSLAD